MNLANTTPQSLNRYNQSATDRHTADKDESLLGHYIQEKGWTLKETLENLAPIAKQTYAQTVSVSSSSKWIAVAGGVIGLIGGGSVGLIGALPIGAAFLAFMAFREANACLNRREVELRALKNCPQLLEVMYGCHLKGASEANLVAAWDLFLDSYSESYGADANQMAMEYLRILDSVTFTVQSSNQSEAQSPQIGDQTRLGAVNIPAQQTTETQQPQSWERPQMPASDIARSLAESLQSTLIVGQPGSGKGLTIAYATREIKQLHPECEIWVIDPKSDPQEAAYWQACDRILNCPIRPFTPADDMEQIKADIEGFITAFQESHAPMKLLIFDEALAVKEKTDKWFKGLMAGFNALCSMGRSRKEYGWLVSQSPNADDYGISGGTRNVYRRVLLIAKSNQGLLANGSTFFSGKPTTEQLEATGRVFFDSASNGWGITPVYPDLVDGSKKSEPQPSRREMLERSLSVDIPSPQYEQVYHSPEIEPEGAAIDGDELAIRAEIKRYLLANSDGCKPRDLARNARSPVRKMPVDDIKFVLDVMTLESEIYEVDGVFFCNSN